MRKPLILNANFVFIFLLFLTSCTDPGTSSTTDQGTNGEATSQEENIDMTPSLSTPDCVVQGQVLEGNTLWMPELDMVAAIKADESTTQEGFEPSHRILELLDGRTCEVKFSETLPVNLSPDFPYYIAQIQYNKGSHLLGIQGYYDVYVCDLDADNKVSKLSPEFFDVRETNDAQSGMILRLEVWEDYLLGYAQDAGAFAFDLSDKSAPKPVIPFAEWQDKDMGRYHSLFLLPTEGGFQAIMPFYDAENDQFMLHPIFEKATRVSINVPKNVRNNEHLVLRNAEDQSKVYAIHLGQRDLIDLPLDIATKKTQEILAWMKAQDQ